MTLERSWAVHAVGLGAVIAAAHVAGAQRTDHLRSERPLRVELSAGTEVVPGLSAAPHAAGPLLAANAGLRWRSDSPVGIRAAGWWLRRDRGDLFDGESMDGVARGASQQLFGAVISADLALRAGRMTIGPSAGAGVASVSGRWRSTVADPSVLGGSQERRRSVSETGTLWTLGVVLRAGRIVLEQHAVGLLGAERAVPDAREFFPLTIGWCF